MSLVATALSSLIPDASTVAVGFLVAAIVVPAVHVLRRAVTHDGSVPKLDAPLIDRSGSGALWYAGTSALNEHYDPMTAADFDFAVPFGNERVKDYLEALDKWELEDLDQDELALIASEQ